jgi:hypoxanthine phosphoribosyltransferase
VGDDSWQRPHEKASVTPTSRSSGPIPCELISWGEVYRLSRRVAFRIQKAGFRPEVIVAIARGGVVPARILCDFFSVYELFSLRVAHYAKGAQPQPVARIVTALSEDIATRRILLVDDVSDTGDTLRLAFDHLKGARPAELKTAVLHHKRTANYAPDFYGVELTQWHWVVYPWAVLEDLSGFIERMEARPQDLADLTRRLYADYGIKVGADTLVDLRSFLSVE